MKPLRRRLLLVISGVLGIADAAFLWHTFKPIYAPITFVGSDSLLVTVPVSKKGATLKNGSWHPALSEAQISAEILPGKEQPLTLVTLTHSSPFPNLIEVIKTLRAQGKCNVVIRGSDEEGVPPLQFRPEGEDLLLPAFVLCGDSIGDAGFHGTLPPDGMVRID
jgi:hypothetical protein